MNLENQLSNLEYSQKLQELGVRQESLYWWKKGDVFVYSSNDRNKTQGAWADIWTSAFTVAELGEMLPQQVRSGKQGEGLGEQPWACFFEIMVLEANTEANARAKMLVYLLENNLITL